MERDTTDDVERPARVATYVLMALAYGLCETAAHPDGRPRLFGVAFGIGLLAVAIVMGYLVRPRTDRTRPSARVSLLLAVVLILPVVLEPLLRELTDEGFPLELQLVNGLRALGLALAGLSAWGQLRRLAAAVALFLALFASAMGDQPAIPYLLAAFAMAGGVWLVLEHRARTGPTVAGLTGVMTDRVPLRMPYREAAVFGVLTLVALGVMVAGPKRVTLALGELVPTSGGTGETDPFARYGVGDGPDETAGDNAKAAGMVETDRMIEDNKNSLIDAVNDMYGPPHKPPKDQERMVAAGKVDIIENHGKLPDNRRPSRDFDTSRKGARSGRTPNSTGPRSVFEVKGRTPLHVRLVVYDTYDATVGRWREAPRPVSLLVESDGGDWMRLTHFRSEADWYSDNERHRLKVADLKSNFVPTPALLTRFRINQVNRPDYYEQDYEGVLTLAGRRRTPPGVVVSTDCRTLDPTRLPETAFAMSTNPALRAVPLELEADLRQLASEWAGSVPHGWPQIEAVLANLRQHYAHDRAAAPPTAYPLPVSWFLRESHRGPDYLFATAAALVLRTLGYQTRVCLGYYAAPDNFDPETDHTPVRQTDLHVWPEVQLSDGHWLVVEPTPGYSVLSPNPTWRDRFAIIAAWVARNSVALSAMVLLAGLLLWQHRRLNDVAHTALWKLRSGRVWHEVVLGAVKVVERRGRYAGQARRANQTLSAWAGGLVSHRPDASLAELVALAEWAVYAPGLAPPVAESDVRSLCRRVLAAWTVRNIAAAKSMWGGNA